MKLSTGRFILSIISVTFLTTIGKSQTTVPEIFGKGSIREQINYIETSTRIYENYRAIREDMFQLIKNRTLDSISKAKTQIAGYEVLTSELNNKIDSLENYLNLSKEESNELSRTKNSIKVLGLNLNKTSYNSMMWFIICALITLLILGFLIFKKNISTTLSTKRDLDELKNEFEQYRQKTRIERDKVSMDHFNEIRKLKGK